MGGAHWQCPRTQSWKRAPSSTFPKGALETIHLGVEELGSNLVSATYPLDDLGQIQSLEWPAHWDGLIKSNVSFRPTKEQILKEKAASSDPSLASHPKFIKQPCPTPSSRQIFSQTFLCAQVCITHENWIALYVESCGLSSPFKHMGHLSLTIHIDLLESVENSFTVFRHGTYQTYHSTLSASPAQEQYSRLQLSAVACAAVNMSAPRRGLVSNPPTAGLSYQALTQEGANQECGPPGPGTQLSTAPVSSCPASQSPRGSEPMSEGRPVRENPDPAVTTPAGLSPLLPGNGGTSASFSVMPKEIPG